MLMIKNILNLKILSVFLLIGFFALSAPPIKRVDALVGYFGGRVAIVIPCTCSTGTSLVTVIGPKGGVFTFNRLTATTYAKRSVAAGKWVIGRYSPGGVCKMTSPPSGCITIPVIGAIKAVGTS